MSKHFYAARLRTMNQKCLTVGVVTQPSGVLAAKLAVIYVKMQHVVQLFQ